MKLYQKLSNWYLGLMFNGYNYRLIKATLKHHDRITTINLYLKDGTVLKALSVVGLTADSVYHTGHRFDGRYVHHRESILRVVYLQQETILKFDAFKAEFERAMHVAKTYGKRVLVLTECGLDNIPRKYYITASSRMYSVDQFNDDYPWVTLAEFHNDKMYCYATVFFGVQHKVFDHFVEEVVVSPPPTETAQPPVPRKLLPDRI